MGLYQLFDPVIGLLDSIFEPMMILGPFWVIFLTSLGISVFITLIYKWVTDQELMKTLKEDGKTITKEIKKLKDDPVKAMAMQKKAFEKQMKYAMHSFKPTLVTFIPIILVFGWLNANMAYEPINPGEEFTTTAKFKDIQGEIELMDSTGLDILSDTTQEIVDKEASWTLNGEEGLYVLQYKFENKTYDMDLSITTGRKYKPVMKKINDGNIKTIHINNNKIIVLNLFGWKIGWLGSYILFSLIFSLSLRKILKVH